MNIKGKAYHIPVYRKDQTGMFESNYGSKIKEILVKGGVMLPYKTQYQKVDNYPKFNVKVLSDHEYQAVIRHIIFQINELLLIYEQEYTQQIMEASKIIPKDPDNPGNKLNPEDYTFGFPDSWPKETGVGKSFFHTKKYEVFKEIFDFIKDNSTLEDTKIYGILYDIFNSNILLKDIFISNRSEKEYVNRKENTKDIKRLIIGRNRSKKD